MPHSNITSVTREKAKKLRTERTKGEARMWNLLRDFRPRGARFRRETPIGPYIADFAWLSKKIVIEVDGDGHETDHGRAHDRVRDAWLRDQGYTVLRFDNADLRDAEDHVFLEIQRTIGRYLDD